MLDKILGLILLRKAMFASTSLIESLLAGIAVIFILALIANVLIASLIVGGIYVAYNALIAYNVTPLTAAVIVGLSILLILAIILIAILLLTHRIKRVPQHFLSRESIIARNINHVIDSFLEGFNAVSLRRRTR